MNALADLLDAMKIDASLISVPGKIDGTLSRRDSLCDTDEQGKSLCVRAPRHEGPRGPHRLGMSVGWVGATSAMVFDRHAAMLVTRPHRSLSRRTRTCSAPARGAP